MTLGEKQELFMRQLPHLINKAHELGYEIRGGDLFRDPRSHGAMGILGVYGHKNSCHKLKLAIDLNLFKDGRFITNDEGHKDIGAWWIAQHPDNRCGVFFSKPDPNHYSMTHEGNS